MLSMLNTLRRGSLMTDPFEAVRWDFERGLSNGSTRGRVFSQPPIALREDDEHVYVEIDVPGMSTEELDLTMHNGQLWIRGERKLPERAGTCWYDERFYGRFERVISLSEALDPSSIEATLENGMLFITLSKTPEARPQRVAIQSANGNGSAKRIASKSSRSSLEATSSGKKSE